VALIINSNSAAQASHGTSHGGLHLQDSFKYYVVRGTGTREAATAINMIVEDVYILPTGRTDERTRKS
jgi:hypothetical protein